MNGAIIIAFALDKSSKFDLQLMEQSSLHWLWESLQKLIFRRWKQTRRDNYENDRA
jgi:hypothetical protein